jgi:hypothetical protein
VKVKACIQNFSGEVFLRYNQLENQEGDRKIIIEMDRMEIGCEDGGWLELAHHHAQCISSVEPLGSTTRVSVNQSVV